MLGIGPRSSVRTRGVGDVLSDAQRALTAAGWQNVSCRTEKVYFPGVDPNTGLNYYEQDVCSVPGTNESFDANIAAMSRPGYGVDLAAERAYYQRNDADFGQERSYFQDYSGPLTQVTAQINADGTRTITPAAAPPSITDWIKKVDAAQAAATAPPATASQAATQQMATTGAVSGAAAGAASGAPQINFDFGSMIDGINPMFLLGGAALVAFMMFKK